MNLVEQQILIIRGQRVLLDSQLARLYGVETKRLVEAVKRNRERFPTDFMFQLSNQEVIALRTQFATPKKEIVVKNRGVPNLKSQFATSSLEHLKIITDDVYLRGKYGGRRKLPYAFTEQGVAMLSSVLKSKRAVETNIAIMRAFVRLREMIAGNADLAGKLEELEKKYDSQFRVVFDAIRSLMEPPKGKEKTVIGFERE